MQSNQSSANIAFRALVMLAFVVAISTIAFSGSALPEKARKLLEKNWPAISSVISNTAADILGHFSQDKTKLQNLPSLPGQTYKGTSNPPGQLTPDNQAVPLSIASPGAGGNGNLLPTSNVVPANYQNVVETRINQPGYGVQGVTNPFVAIQDRLRQLGATYYLLETWGNQRQFFRFYCQMSVGGNASYTHYFEATNPDPMAAMADVLRQVEAWRLGKKDQ